MAGQLQLQPVDLGPALKRQFYPILILLICLTAIHPYRREALSPTLDFTNDPEQFFHGFVSKLAFLCCTEPSGPAVSACAVLQTPEGIQYVFGFNDRKESALRDIKSGITAILTMFRHPLPREAHGREALQKRALVAALRLNQNRVKSYLKSFAQSLQDCIEACERADSPEAQLIQTNLSVILSHLRPCIRSSAGSGKILVDTAATYNLIRAVDRWYKSNNFSLIKARLAREEEFRASTWWADCVHASGRLLSYEQAIKVTFEASSNWDILFEEFEVIMIKSSSAMAGALRTNPMSAKDIARRMSGPDTLPQYEEQLASLPVQNIDESIKEEWAAAPKPIVHAEVLVHHWLEITEGGIRPERFFKGWKFIGSSKPPCKLCSYFFEAYPTDVKVRPSSHNIFFAWRMPDVYEHQGIEEINKRRDAMQKIKARICEDIKRVFSERLRDGRPHDSSAYTALTAFREGELVTEPLAEEIIPDFSSLTISEDPKEDSKASEKTIAENDELEEDEHEVVLFKGRSAMRPKRPSML